MSNRDIETNIERDRERPGELGEDSSETITVRVPVPVVREIERIAESMHESRSVAHRRVLRAGLDSLRAAA